MGRFRCTRGHIELRLGEVGFVVNHAHRAAHRTRTVQRALRPAQHFDARDVGHLDVGEERSLVHIRRDQRRRNVLILRIHAARVESANGELAVHAARPRA